jgi:2-oxoglutarate ferredoxin oxidoreductase subunit beta
MTYLAKPKLHHPSLPKNALGYTRAIMKAPFPPYAPAVATIRSAQRSFKLVSSSTAAASHRQAVGIGCSSKTPTYFLGKLTRLQQCALAACPRC